MTTIRKIICPNPEHKEKTPSFAIYPDGGAFCFGCGYSCRATDIGETAPSGERYVEDVTPKVEYIRSLPLASIRGLQLPADSHSYYLLWDNGSYYLRRGFVVGDGEPKYRGPAGVPRPLLERRSYGKDHLIVCEGEINALSLAEAGVRADIVSPGSAGEFYSKRAERYLSLYKKYPYILLIADKDAPGAKACIELKSRLLLYTPHVRIKLMEHDANDILVEHGKEVLKAEIERDLGVLGRLPREKGSMQAPGEAPAEALAGWHGVHGQTRAVSG